jgi:plasmid stabilization system protein ParE
MPHVSLDALAEDDLARIAEFIGETNHSPEAARRLIRGLDAKFQLYAHSHGPDRHVPIWATK